VLLASFMSPFAAMIRRGAMALGGILMLLRGSVMCFDYVVFFIHWKAPCENPVDPGSLNSKARRWPC